MFIREISRWCERLIATYILIALYATHTSLVTSRDIHAPMCNAPFMKFLFQTKSSFAAQKSHPVRAGLPAKMQSSFSSRVINPQITRPLLSTTSTPWSS